MEDMKKSDYIKPTYNGYMNGRYGEWKKRWKRRSFVKEPNTNLIFAAYVLFDAWIMEKRALLHDIKYHFMAIKLFSQRRRDWTFWMFHVIFFFLLCLIFYSSLFFYLDNTQCRAINQSAIGEVWRMNEG